MKTGYYANLGEHRFTLGRTNIEVLELIPPNTPVKVLQIIYVEYDGREVISDGEELLKTSADLWHWIQDIQHLVYLEFTHPFMNFQYQIYQFFGLIINIYGSIREKQRAVFCHHNVHTGNASASACNRDALQHRAQGYGIIAG